MLAGTHLPVLDDRPNATVSALGQGVTLRPAHAGAAETHAEPEVFACLFDHYLDTNFSRRQVALQIMQEE